MKLGTEGYGIYFMILERLREEPDYTSVKDYNVLAFDLRVGTDKVKSVVEDFGLFDFTDDCKRFYSKSFLNRMALMNNQNEKRREAGRKGAATRWQCHGNAIENNSNAMAMLSKNIATKPNQTKPNKTKQSSSVLILERFALFWNSYPRKVGTGKAREAFLKLQPSQELTERMIRAVAVAEQSDQWQKDNGQFIPNPATWLNQRRWEDEPLTHSKPMKGKLYECTTNDEDERILREQQAEIEQLELSDKTRNTDGMLEA